MCHMSCVTCNIFFYQVVKIFGGGCVINGSTPSSLTFLLPYLVCLVSLTGVSMHEFTIYLLRGGRRIIYGKSKEGGAEKEEEKSRIQEIINLLACVVSSIFTIKI